MPRYKRNDNDEKIKVIPLAEMQKFFDDVDILAKKRFGVDWEGNHNLEIIMLDRARYDYMGYLPVPRYDFGNRYDMEALADHLRFASCNANTAQGKLDTTLRILESYVRDGVIVAGKKE